MTRTQFDANTRAELIYLMRFHNLKEIWVYFKELNKPKKEIVGRVILDGDKLSYDHRNCWRYMTKDEDAYLLAVEQIADYVNLLKSFQSDEIVQRKATHIHERSVWEYADADGIVRHHTFPTTKRTKTEQVLVGTLDNIFEQFKDLNRHLRYCNGEDYVFEDENTKFEHSVWYKWISKSRSMDLYYGKGGIVD